MTNAADADSAAAVAAAASCARTSAMAAPLPRRLFPKKRSTMLPSADGVSSALAAVRGAALPKS